MSTEAIRRVLCDDCKPAARTMLGPLPVEIKLSNGHSVEDVYRCKVNTCGRMYGPVSGYFNEEGSGRGYRLRAVSCNSAEQRPMYIKSIRHGAMPNEDVGVFKCPECGHEREEKIPTIAAGSM